MIRSEPNAIATTVRGPRGDTLTITVAVDVDGAAAHQKLADSFRRKCLSAGTRCLAGKPFVVHTSEHARPTFGEMHAALAGLLDAIDATTSAEPGSIGAGLKLCRAYGVADRLTGGDRTPKPATP